MNEEKHSYLVQRCQVKTMDKECISGIDSLLRFDYMGSSEFEWGALPKALKELCKVSDDLIIKKVTFRKAARDRATMYLVTARNEAEENVRMLRELSDKKRRTKEYVGIQEYLLGHDDQHVRRNFQAWWDIDHRWIVCINKKLAELVIHAIGKVKARWEKEGKL